MSRLSNRELYWVEKQPWSLSRGYQPRARYQPGWIPSWITNPPAGNDGGRLAREDFAQRVAEPVMDAIRVVDDTPVMLKKISSEARLVGDELVISQYVSSVELLKDPDNHCVPVYEVLEIPDDDDFVIIVMPLLRPFDSPRFDTIGEILEFLHQIFKGIQFLYRHRIAHRQVLALSNKSYMKLVSHVHDSDCTGLNVMMDASELYPDGFHPIEVEKTRDCTGPAVQKYTRTQRPPKYYWIDFGLSVRFDESDRNTRTISLRGNDKSAPEFQVDDSELHRMRDPFPTDIYYLGNLIRTYFTEGDDFLIDGWKYGVGFFKPLVEIMVQEDPSKRPTID